MHRIGVDGFYVVYLRDTNLYNWDLAFFFVTNLFKFI